MPITNRRILLASRPTGQASVANFRADAVTLPPLQPGQVLVRNHFLSLDPYMRGRMNDSRSYAAPQALEEVMLGGTAGVVIESLNPAWKPGDKVVAGFGWQEYGISDGTGLRRVDDSRVRLSAFLGAVGMPGVTAWYGLNRICEPKPGETVVVSAASGAVGAVVGQLAKRQGCRVIGVAGGEAKCRFLVDELGFDAFVDYKAGRLESDLAAAAPKGIDAYFDNVGGAVLDAVMDLMNPHGRIAICGAISRYDAPGAGMRNPVQILIMKLKLQGFIISDPTIADVWPPALAELEELAATGQLTIRETIAEGLESAPEAFIGLLAGRNFGKQLVRLA